MPVIGSPITAPIGALTSLADVKLYMGITDTTQDAKLTALLPVASEAIENYCDCTFASASLVEYFDGRDNWRNGYLHLKRMPVTAITRIASEPQVALAILNQSDSVDIATVQVTATGVVLTAVASGVSTTNTLLFVTYTTITAMASAITTLGWTATVSQGFGNYPSSYLRQPQGALTAKSAPLSSGAQLMIYSRELAIANIDYDEGTIYGFFPRGYQQAEVRYTAGYTTIPSAVQLAVCMVVKAMNDQSKIDPNLAYEKLGDYSWGRRTDQLIDLTNAIFADALPLLAKYRRVRAL